MSAGLLAALALAAASGAGPRVFSADFCADQLTLALADESQIAALSPDAEKGFSYLRRKAAGLPQARAEAEQIVARNADVVLRFWGGDAARFARLGVEVVTLDYAADFDAVKFNIRRAAAALGRPERGAALIADLDERLARLETTAPRPRAFYVTPGGVTAGAGTMIDAILTAAGASNAGADGGVQGWPALPLEALVAAPPALIVAGFFSAEAARADHWSAARHPAFERAFAEARVIHLPADVLSCPGWFSVAAAERIRDVIAGGEEK